MSYEPVLTKKDFVRRYKQGEFGNASPTWDTFEEYRASEYLGLIHVRNRIKGAETWYNVPKLRSQWTWDLACLEFRPEDLYISAMAPTKRTTLQGEVQRGVWSLDLHYTDVKKPMRDALADWSKSVSGLVAHVLLADHLCTNSYTWLMDLLDRYKDHVVEFSAYEIEWGTLPGFNTVFWEVRKY